MSFNPLTGIRCFLTRAMFFCSYMIANVSIP